MKLWLILALLVLAGCSNYDKEFSLSSKIYFDKEIMHKMKYAEPIIQVVPKISIKEQIKPKVYKKTYSINASSYRFIRLAGLEIDYEKPRLKEYRGGVYGDIKHFYQVDYFILKIRNNNEDIENMYINLTIYSDNNSLVYSTVDHYGLFPNHQTYTRMFYGKKFRFTEKLKIITQLYSISKVIRHNIFYDEHFVNASDPKTIIRKEQWDD